MNRETFHDEPTIQLLVAMFQIEELVARIRLDDGPKLRLCARQACRAGRAAGSVRAARCNRDGKSNLAEPMQRQHNFAERGSM